MNKVELQQQAELVIKPINEITNMDFKLSRIQIDTILWFNEDSDDKDRITYWYLTDIKSHSIGIEYYPNAKDGGYKYKCRYWKLTNGRMGNAMEQCFKTELELLVFLKQSKFKIK